MRIFVALLCACALAACSSDAERYVSSASAHLASGRDKEAAIQLRNAVDSEPDHPEANFLLGRLLAKVGNPVDAEIILVRALKAGYPQPQVLPILGDVYLELERYAPLLELLSVVDSGDDRSFLARIAILRGRAHLGLRQFLEARTQITLALKDRPQEAKLALAELAMATDDWPGAEVLLGELKTEYPKFAEGWIARGALLRRGGRDDDAVSAYREASALAPENPVPLISEAVVYLARDELGKAKPLLEKAALVAPLKPMLEFANGLLALKEKRFEDTRAALQRLFDAVPTYGPGLLLAGALNFTTERFDLAENSYRDYLKHDPGNVFARKMLAATLVSKGRPELALDVVKQFTERSTDPELWLIAGRANLAVGRVQQALAILGKAVEKAQSNADVRLNFGIANLVAGKRPKAIAEFEAAIALSPTDGRADRALGMTLLADGQITRAEQVAQAMLRRLPKSPDAHTLAGTVELARRSDASARKYFEQALALNPTFIPAAEALADIDHREGVSDALRKRMEAVLAADATNLDALLILARNDLDRGAGEKSAARIRELLTTHPRSVRGLQLLAESQLRMGQFAEAISTARRANDEHPWDSAALYLLSDAQIASGDTAGAVVTLEKAISIAPGSPEPHLRIAAVLVQAGDLRGAVSRLNELLRKDRANVAARLLLGRVFVASKRYEDALRIAGDLQRSMPRQVAGHRLEGEVAMATGVAERAVRAFQRAEALHSNGEVRMWLHRARTVADGRLAPTDGLQQWLERYPADRDVRRYLADSLMDAGRYGDASDHYEVLLKFAEVDDAAVLNNLAWCALQLGRETALDYAQRAVKRSPENARVLDTLGVVLLRSNRAAEAVQVLLRAQSRSAEDPEIRIHLAEALIQIGDGARARRELETILRGASVTPRIRQSADALLAKL